MADCMIRQSAARELERIRAYSVAQSGDKNAVRDLVKQARGSRTVEREEKERKKAMQEARLALKLWRLN